MIAFLIGLIKDTFEKFRCKHCNFKTFSGIHMLLHIKKYHHCTPTKRDVKFVLRHNLGHRIACCTIAVILFIPLTILKIVLLPLHLLYEIL